MTNVTSESSKPSNHSCPVPHHKYSNGSDVEGDPQRISHGPKYEWDQSDQGNILGAFFYSYIVLQVPVAILAQKYGGKWIVAISLIGSGVVNLLTPLIASSYLLLITSRILLGAAQAATYPAIYDIMCSWMPLKERSLAYAIIEAGGAVGSIASSAVAGYVSDQTTYGWPAVYYLCGGLALGYSVIFIFAIKSKPEEHSLTSDEELKYIFASNDRKEGPEVPKSTPWLGIVTSKVVLSVIMVKFGGAYVYYTLSSKLPSYLSDVIHVDLTENGLLNSATYLITAVSAIICGGLSERVIQWNWLSRTRCRKVFSLIANVGMAISLALVPAAGCSELWAMVLVMFAYLFIGFNSGGDVPVPGEITTHFPAIVYSYMNAVSITSGFIAPAAIGYTLNGFDDPRVGWDVVFYTASIMAIVGYIIFMIFGSTKRQSFDFIQEEKVVTIRHVSINNNKVA